MSVNITFVNDVAVSLLEVYKPNVSRTIETTFQLPWDRDEIYFQSDFFTSFNFNTHVDKIFENFNYLRGFATIYNSVLPIEQSECTEYDQVDKIGCDVSDNYEITFTNKEVKVYIAGVIDQTITETNFGLFRNIKDVVIIGNFLLINDGNHILKLDISTIPATFITFFGGYGGSDSEYKFQSPVKIIRDKTNDDIYIWDKGNKKLKRYNSNLTYEQSIGLIDNVIDLDVYNGELFYLTSNHFHNNTTGVSLEHNLLNAEGITVDTSQAGFVWVNNSTTINKFTIGGLPVGSYTSLTNIKDIVRYDTKLNILDGDTWLINLDFASTITTLSVNDTVHDIDAVNILPDELVSDWVINDSMYKIYENVDALNLALTGGFIVNRNTTSNILGVDIVSKSVSGCVIDCNYNLNHDEIVSCNVINRGIDQLYDLFFKTGNKMLGIDAFIIDGVSGFNEPDQDDFIPLNWSLGAQSCEGISPQIFNPNFTPITFDEFQNPILSCNPLTAGGCTHIEAPVSGI